MSKKQTKKLTTNNVNRNKSWLLQTDYYFSVSLDKMPSLQSFFKRQVLSSNALLHYLLPEQRDNDTVCSLRYSQPFPSIRARTNKFYFLALLFEKLHIIIVYSE